MSGRILACAVAVVCAMPCANLPGQQDAPEPLIVPTPTQEKMSRTPSVAEQDPPSVDPADDSLLVAPTEDSLLVAPSEEPAPDSSESDLPPAGDIPVPIAPVRRSVHRHQPSCRSYAKPSKIYLRHQKYWGNAAEFCERPFGSYVRDVGDAQIINGIAAQMALYDYDFHGMSLTPRGKYQVQKIVDRMIYQVEAPIVIEGTGNTDVDQGRRLSVVTELAQLGVPAADQMVVSRTLIRPGLMGVEALEIFTNRLNQTTVGGAGVIDTSSQTTSGVGQ